MSTLITETRYVVARTAAEAEQRVHHTALSEAELRKALRLRRMPGERVYPVTVTVGEPLEEPQR